MSRLQKATDLIEAGVLLVAATIIIVRPGAGYPIVLLMLSLALVFNGLSSLWYYFTMARHMVGGWRSLFTGILVLDAGLFTISLNQLPRIYILLYLSAVYIFKGGIDIVNAINAIKMESTHYKAKMVAGIINVVLGISCIALMKWDDYVVFVYAGGLVYNAVVKIVGFFRKEELVYIQ